MKKIDHVAIVVNDIEESITYYTNNYDCKIIHADKTWGFLQFANIKLALVLEGKHPPHLAFEVDSVDGVRHRDGSISKYIHDPSDNAIELIEYPK
ncbi:MAG: glyoxalase [Candidatus Marinimicrobia bacterium]|nr:glyoxalase [Candidatus Neomarinimicrobiota bacterium]|tara:strand:+ start:298 stop:582 length:285 start_codon:yes stop_codon:yes gene_type:complete